MVLAFFKKNLAHLMRLCFFAGILASGSAFGIVDVIGSWVNGTTHTVEAGSNRAFIVFTYGEDGAAFSATGVTYGTKAMTKIIDKAQNDGTCSYTSAWILNETDIAAASTSTISVTWSAAPGGSTVESVFLSGVNQSTLTGTTSSNGASPATNITSTALSNSSGDMAFVAGVAGVDGNYTVDSGFAKTYEAGGLWWGDAVAGIKTVTGTNETPSITLSSSQRQAIIGFVIKTSSVPKTWDGGGGTGTWTTDANWDAGPYPTTGADIIFAGTSQLAVNHNNTAATSYSSFTFAGGAGAFTLSGTSVTLGGNVANNSSNLQTISLDIALSGARTVTTAGGSMKISGIISGGYGLTKAGIATLTLTNTQTYTGATTISGGTLQIGDGTTDGSIATSSGITDNAALIYNILGSRTYANVISGTGTLTKSGSGTLTLSGTNTYSGATTVSVGTLTAGIATSSFGSSSAVTTANTANTSIDISGFSTTIGSLAGGGTNGGNVILTGKTLTTGGDNTSTTYSGALSGASGALTKTGAGAFTLAGTSTYTGATTVSNGTLLVTGATSSSSAVAVNSGGTLGGGTWATPGTVAGAITVNNGGTLAPGTGGTTIGKLTTGAVTFSTTSTYSVDLDGASPTNDQINSTGTVALGSGTNTLTVASIANSSPGDVYTIISGTSVTGTFNGKAEGSTFTVSGRTLRINYTATEVTLTDASGAGILGSWGNGSDHTAPSGSNRALIVFVYAQDFDPFSATGVTYGTQAMTKIVESGYESTGSSYTYTSAWILNDAGITAASSTTIAVTWSTSPGSNYTLEHVFLSGVYQASPTGSTGSSGQDNVATITTEALVTTNEDMVFVAGTSESEGSYTVNNSFTEAWEADAIGWGDAVAGYKAATGANETPSLTQGSSKRQTIIGFVVRHHSTAKTWDGGDGSNSWVKDANWDAGPNPTGGEEIVFAGTTQLAVNHNYTAATSYNSFVFASGAGAFTLSGNSITLGGNIINNSSNLQTISANLALSGNRTVTSASANIALSGIISGSYGLTKTGTATLTLTNTHTYTGATIISAGTLQVGNGSTNCVFSGTSGITNNAALVFNTASSKTYNVVISGSGTVTQTGSGLILSGANTYTGLTTINGYTKPGANTSVLGSTDAGTVVNSGGCFDFAGYGMGVAEPITLNGTGGGNGALWNSGGAATYSGLLTLGSSSTIKMSGGALTLSNTGTITASGSGYDLTFDCSSSGTVNSIIGTGTGGVIKNSAGTLTLAGSNTYTGATTISAGTLLITGGTSSGSAVAINSTGTLGGGTWVTPGSIAGTIAVNNGGTLAPGIGGTTIGKLTTGAVTFSTTSTYSVDLEGFTPSCDQINSTGTVALGAATNTLTVASISASLSGTVYTIISGTSVTGTFNGKAEASTFVVSGVTLRINYTATTVTLTDVTAGGADTHVWDGGGGGSYYWNTGTNWVSDVAPVANDALQFAGSTGTTNNNDITAATNFASITFNSGAGAFTLNGTSITLAGGITNSSGNLQTINVDMAGGTTRTISAASANIAIGGIISGAGGLTKTGTATLTLTGTNSYTGTTTISTGTLKMQGVALSTTPRNYTIASGAVLNFDGNISPATGTSVISGAGTLRITGGTLSGDAGSGRDITLSMSSGGLIDVQSGGTLKNGFYQYLNWTGNLAAINVDGTLELWNGNTIYVDALTGSGTVNNGNGNVTVSVGANNGTGTFTGLITNNTGIANLIKTGTGIQTLSGTNSSYTGTTSIQNGTLRISAINNLSSNSSIGAPSTAVNGTIALGSGTTTGALAYTGGTQSTNRLISLPGTTGGGAIDQSGSGTLTLSNTNIFTPGAGAKTITLQGSTSGAGVLAGIIADYNSANKTSLVKSGTGTWTLSGTNTFTGATSVNAGTLLVTGATNSGSAVTVANGATLGGTGTVAGAITVSGGGAVAPGVGGIGALYTGSLTFSATSTYSVDLDGTTPTYDQINSSSGTVTCAGTLTVASITNAAVNKAYVIVSAANVSGTFAGLPNNGYFQQQGRVFQIVYTGTTVTITDKDLVAATWTATSLGSVNGGSMTVTSLYLGTGTSSGAIKSMNLTTGATLWSYPTAAGCRMPTYVWDGSNYKIIATEGSNLVGVTDNGAGYTELWGGPKALGGAAGNPYVTPDDGNICVVAGTTLTRRSLANPTSISLTQTCTNVSVGADMVVMNDEVYVAATNGVVTKIDYDGTPISTWTVPNRGAGVPGVYLPLMAATVADSLLYVFPKDEMAYSVKTSTMTTSGTWTYAARDTNCGPSFMSFDGHTRSGVIYTSAGKKIYKLTEGSGAPTWAYAIPGDSSLSGPVMYNGKVYFGTQDSSYYAVTDNGGSATIVSKWPYAASTGKANTGPWIDPNNSRLYFGTTGGRVDAFPLQ